MTTHDTAARPTWDAIPETLRAAIIARTGPVLRAESQAGGYTPGLAVRLELGQPGQPADERVFVKALPASHPLAGSYRDEIAAGQRIPPTVPAPGLLWSVEQDGWIAAGYENVDGRLAVFEDPSPDLDDVLAAIAAARVPVDGLPDVRAQRRGWMHGWAELAATGTSGLDPWAADRLPQLARAETLWLDYSAEATLLHGDIRADNVMITRHGAVIIDWAHASAGPGYPDLCDLVRQLILAGHHPGEAERYVKRDPAWRDVPAEVITSYAAALTGYSLRSSRLPAPHDAPRVRPYQAKAAQTGIEWIRWRESRNPVLT